MNDNPLHGIAEALRLLASAGGDRPAAPLTLAKKQRFASPFVLISATTGASVGEAVRIIQVGEATAPRVSLAGEPLPAKHPHVAAAVAAGSIGMTAASAIVSLLDRVAMRVDSARLDDADQQLVALAPGSVRMRSPG